ncbi:MAG: flavodoxin family protein [Chloroflexi bacterium]|nr:flavodoxin family protein [Chloroflexota bacterium]
MKITAFNGSPRGERGNTHTMVEAFFDGARESGAEAENIPLVKKKIRHCLGCFECWTLTPGKCIIRDDMDELLPKYLASDIVVMATPVYVDNVTGIMKDFMDRLIPIVDPHFEKDEAGEYRHVRRYDKYPNIVVISNSGFPEQSHFQVLHLLFQRIARNMRSKVVAEVYRGGGEILREKSLFLRPFTAGYLKTVGKAGKEGGPDVGANPCVRPPPGRPAGRPLRSWALPGQNRRALGPSREGYVLHRLQGENGS